MTSSSTDEYLMMSSRSHPNNFLKSLYLLNKYNFTYLINENDAKAYLKLDLKTQKPNIMPIEKLDLG